MAGLGSWENAVKIFLKFVFGLKSLVSEFVFHLFQYLLSPVEIRFACCVARNVSATSLKCHNVFSLWYWTKTTSGSRELGQLLKAQLPQGHTHLCSPFQLLLDEPCSWNNRRRKVTRLWFPVWSSWFSINVNMKAMTAAATSRGQAVCPRRWSCVLFLLHGWQHCKHPASCHAHPAWKRKGLLVFQ